MLWIFYLVMGIVVLLLGMIYFLQEKLIFFPEKVNPDYKYPFQHPFEEVI